MHAFYLSLVAVAALSELASALSPERGREHVRRIAALVTLLVILVPVRGLWDRREALAGELSALFAPRESGTAELPDYAESAEFIFTYAEYSLGIGREGMTVRFQTDEGGRAERIHVTVGACPYNLRRSMEEELTRTFGIPVRVRTEEAREE
ncbi:MAG: hypothetical protein II889_12650 [Clostridia bacterium]|nr:hypothetical protein [Clostridia bacterium]